MSDKIKIRYYKKEEEEESLFFISSYNSDKGRDKFGSKSTNEI